jgi:hypothetical protein
MERPTYEDVAAFLAQHSGGAARDREPLTGGAFSSAWAYRADEEELVIRFGPERSWYEADRMAKAFNGPDLLVPQIKAAGTTPAGRAYAISVRRFDGFWRTHRSSAPMPSPPPSPACSSRSTGYPHLPVPR